MCNFREAFDILLYETLLPEFCADQSRGMRASGFVRESNKVSLEDAQDFLKAWNAGLAVHNGRGQYKIGAGKVLEQFFWSGLKTIGNRKLSLWLEPIITLGAIGRLHFDYNWPIKCIASQSSDWAYDIISSTPVDSKIVIAGEVKKNRSEVDELFRLMKGFAEDPKALQPKKGKERNAYKKVISLRKLKAPILWLVGPERYELTFLVKHEESGVIVFDPAPNIALEFAVNLE